MKPADDMGGLSEYLAEFAAAPKPTQSSQVGLVKVSVRDAQHALVGFHNQKLTLDGKYGPSTRGVWQKVAISKKLNPAFDRASATEAWVHPDTFKSLTFNTLKPTSAAAVPPPKAPAPKPVTGLVNISVLQAQKQVNALGASLKEDGQYGPKTKSGWETTARKLGVPPAFKRVSVTTVSVSPTTIDKMQKTAIARGQAPVLRPLPAPAPRPQAPVVAGITKNVIDLQRILIALGAPKSKDLTDGLYGKVTVGWWQKAAAAQGLPTLVSKVNTKQVRVPEATFNALYTSAQSAAKQPAPPKTSTPLVIKLVSDLQSVLLALGSPRTQALTDGAYGPTTAKEWIKTAMPRKLGQRFEKVDARHARVEQKTYDALRAEADKARKSGVTPAPKPLPAPVAKTVTLTVSTTQKGLNAFLGTNQIPLPLLDTDGVWGAKSAQALEAWLKTRPGGANAPYNVKGKAITLPVAFGKSLEVAAAAAPAPPPRVSLPVVTVVKGLQSLGMSGPWRAALTTFIKRVDLIDTGYKVSKDGKTVLKLRKNVADKITSAATPARGTSPDKSAPVVSTKPSPPAPPAPRPVLPADPVALAAEKLRPQFSTPVPVSDVQKYAVLANTASAMAGQFPSVKVTGRWDQATADALPKVLGIQDTFHPVWHALYPKILSPDRTEILLTDLHAQAMQQAAKIYAERMAPPAPEGGSIQVPEPGTPMPAPASETQAPMVLAPAPVPGQDMEPAPSPAPVMEPVPQQLSPAKLAAGAQAWQKMVSALNQFATVAPIYAKAIADAGENIGPGAKQAFEDWAAKADGLKLRVKEIIENTPQLQQAIDAVGGAAAQPQGEDVAGLAAYFGFLASYSSEAVSLLATPLPTGFNGLGNPALMWAERLAGPAWRGLMQVLGSRTVATVGATAVAANSLEDALTGETEEYLESNRHLAEMVAEGKLTADQAVQLKEKPSSSNGALVVGAVALGALGVWYLSRSKA